MKTASAATKAILATGQYFKAELYQFDLVGGTTMYFTSAEDALTVAGHTYQTGLIIMRGQVTQKVGLEVQSLDLTIVPQADAPGGPPTFGGASFLVAVDRGVFDGCRTTMSKIFLSSWADTSPGLVPWFQGRMNRGRAGRLYADITVNSDPEILNIAMPRNLIQTGCIHTVFDAGCTLLSSAFQVSGTISGSPTVTQFNTNLTQANGYWDLGTITFTSGANSGVKRVLKAYLNGSGQVTLIQPLLSPLVAGDTFTIIPSCKKTQAGRSKAGVSTGPAYNLLAVVRGMPDAPAAARVREGGGVGDPVPA